MRAFGIVLALLMFVPVAWADERDEKIESAKKRVAAMLGEAEELQELGRGEDARRLRRQAGDLMAEMKAFAERRKKQNRQHRRDDAERLSDVLRGLENGIEALVALGREEEAARLREIAADLSRKKEKRGADRERAVARGYIRVLRVAMHALIEADRHDDAAGIVEHTIHAMEMRLEGRRDAEAREMMERAPKPDSVAEALMIATEILQDRRQEKQAGQVRELAQMYLKKHRRRGGERERPRERERIARLEDRVAQMERRLARLTDLLEEFTRDMERRRRSQ